MKLIFLILATSLFCQKRSTYKSNEIIATCSFKEWIQEYQFDNKLLKLDISDESGAESLMNCYFLEWQSNCLVLLSTKTEGITLKIPLLVRNSNKNCGDLDGLLIYKNLKCKFNNNFSRIVDGKVDMTFKLIDQKSEIYEVVHQSRDGSGRTYTIGFKDGFIKMKTTLLDGGRIPKY